MDMVTILDEIIPTDGLSLNWRVLQSLGGHIGRHGSMVSEYPENGSSAIGCQPVGQSETRKYLEFVVQTANNRLFAVFR
jgi:hypothetical protein